MSDTSNTSGNNPSTNPITLANKFQDSFFPFSAFTFDDPNTSSVPNLNLTPPWQFSAAHRSNVLSQAITTANVTLSVDDIYNYDTIILSGTPTAWRTLTIPQIPRHFTVVMSCTGSYGVYISTGASGGKIATLPALSSNETTYQTYYTCEIVCDGTNVYFTQGQPIFGRTATTNGYMKFLNGMLVNYVRDTVTANITEGPADDEYYVLSTWGFPCAFYDTNYALSGVARVTGHIIKLSGSADHCTATTAYVFLLSGTSSLSSVTVYRQLMAIGRWK